MREIRKSGSVGGSWSASPRSTLNGHRGGNAGNGQGPTYRRTPTPYPTLQKLDGSTTQAAKLGTETEAAATVHRLIDSITTRPFELLREQARIEAEAHAKMLERLYKTLGIFGGGILIAAAIGLHFDIRNAQESASKTLETLRDDTTKRLELTQEDARQRIEETRKTLNGQIESASAEMIKRVEQEARAKTTDIAIQKALTDAVMKDPKVAAMVASAVTSDAATGAVRKLKADIATETAIAVTGARVQIAGAVADLTKDNEKLQTRVTSALVNLPPNLDERLKKLEERDYASAVATQNEALRVLSNQVSELREKDMAAMRDRLMALETLSKTKQDGQPANLPAP